MLSNHSSVIREQKSESNYIANSHQDSDNKNQYVTNHRFTDIIQVNLR